MELNQWDSGKDRRGKRNIQKPKKNWQADVNANNYEALSPFHILLVSLLDLADVQSLPEEQRAQQSMTDEIIVGKMSRQVLKIKLNPFFFLVKL